MKKNILFLISVILISSTFYGQSQDRIFKFIQSGTNADVSMTAIDSLGNLYIAGTFRNSFEFGGLSITGNPNGDAYDSYLLKVLPNGKALYLKAFVSEKTENSAAIKDIDVNNKGEVAVILSAPSVNSVKIGGRTITLSASEANQVIAKISRNGFLMWAKRIRVTGGETNIGARDVELDTSGNVYVAGNFSGQTAYFGSNTIEGFTNGYTKLFIAKYAADGTNLWASTCDVSSDIPSDTTGSIYAYNLEIGTGNRIYISGDYDGTRRFEFGASSLKNEGLTNAYLACYNITGDFAWLENYGGEGTIRSGDIEIDRLNNVLTTCFYESDTFRANGSIYVAYGVYNMLVSKYEQNGTFLWDTPITTGLSYVGAINEDSKIFIDDSLHAIIVGNIYQSGVNHFYTVKLHEQTGNSMYIKYSENISTVNYDHVTADKKGDIYIAGTTYSTFVFNGYTVISSTAYGTAFLIKMNNQGDHIYGYQKENTTDQSVYFKSVEVDNFKNLMISGKYIGSTINLDNNVNTIDNSGIFVARYTPVAEIQGKVLNLSGSGISNGYVKLLGYAIYQRCPVSDSVLINSDGSYSFTNVPLGMYLLHAYPGTTLGIDYLPAFHVSSGHWEEAERLEVDDQITYADIDILVPQRIEMQGSGGIEGLLLEVEEDDIFKSVMNKPRARSKATLAKSKLKSDYDIIAITETDAYGYFYFFDVEGGEYIVFIEEPGLPNISVHNITITGNSYVSSVDFLMNEENIEAVGDPQTSNILVPDRDEMILVYPNPSSGSIYISTTDNTSVQSLKVLSIDGKTLVHKYILQNNEFIELDLNPGVYILQMDTKSQSVLKKLIISK